MLARIRGYITQILDYTETNYPSLFDENFMPKPAFYALVGLVKK